MFALIAFIWVFSIPGSMSVYLANDFARTSKKLELELVHVKQLGEQNVQKEIEKQEIIKGQKQELETKVREATAEIMEQKNELAEKNRDISDSINYAQRIQTAILPDNTLLDQALGEYLVLFRPKDVVSGDFFWCHKINDKVIFAVADCTGHGVPGAFMSMIGISLFNEIVLGKGITEANAILDELRRKLSVTLQQNTEHPSNRDGMDIALCVWNREDNVLQFAGANNSLYLLSENIAENGSVQETDRVKLHNRHLLQILPDKQPIGYQEDKMNNPFTKSIIQLRPGDTIFISSDGFTDQFGGQKNKKFTSGRFRSLLASLMDKSIREQKMILEQTLDEWKKGDVQTDDICVVGVKIT
ncbi:MAG: SpoIIE family protein phosphatase [Bacteroidia bacterium]|nr:SpoIIE family protein phosphatase [Bacteroidia bacterium]